MNHDAGHPGSRPTRRLRWGYLAALALLACLVIGTQAVVQWSIRRQADDARLINLAGRQRMLSQRLAKAALALRLARVEGENPARAAAANELADTLTLWERSHHALRDGDAELGLRGRNSPAMRAMYRDLAPSFAALRDAAHALLALDPQPEDEARVRALTLRLIEGERDYLPRMDRIVFQYDHEARAHVDQLQRIELALAGLTLLVLPLLALLIFEPTRRALTLQWSHMQQQRDRLGKALAVSETTSIAKSRLLSHISHEVRNPMTAILGCAELLGEQDLTPTQRAECLSIIQNHGRRLVATVDEILDMAKLDADEAKPQRGPVELAPLVSEVLRLVRPEAERKGLGLAIECLSATPAVVTTDPAWLSQALLHLLANAIKFTDHGAVTLRLSVTQPAAGRPRLRLAVRDTGIGVEPADAQRIFEPFTQTDRARAHTPGGVGLGLTLARRYAQALGGDIELESTPDAGSTFTLWIDPGPIDPQSLTPPTGSTLLHARETQ